MSGKYAAGTEVPIGRSREEIEKLITRYGARRFVYGWDDDSGAAVIEFEMRDRRVRFRMDLPQLSDHRTTPTGRARTATATREAWEAACRQRWRALVLVLKAKLESVETGIEEFDEAFLPQIVVPGGRPFADHALPAIAEAYRTNVLPPMLLALGEGAVMSAPYVPVWARCGARLRALRLSRGLRAQQLAIAMEVANATVSRWETGVKVMSADSLDLAVAALHLDADEAQSLRDAWRESGAAKVGREDPAKRKARIARPRPRREVGGEVSDRPARVLGLVPVLRCASPTEYLNWMRYGLNPSRRAVPLVIERPSMRFCHDADPGWCMQQRSAGLCCRSEAEFADILRRQEVA